MMPKLLKRDTLGKALKKGQVVKPLTADEVARRIDGLRTKLQELSQEFADLSGELYSRNVKDDVPF